MATYAIGDIQGCREQFEALLELIQFDPTADKLWLAGDLVNRGPDSLGTMRLIYSIRESVIAVLGNHDLHMLAVAADSNRAKPKHTFLDLLEAPDAEELLYWLRHCPLAHLDGEFLMVHAGIHPLWDFNLTLELAAEVETVLRSDQSHIFFQNMYGNKPDLWSPDLTGYDRLRFITNTLTRMRFCYANGALNMKFKRQIKDAPKGLIPWFDMKNRLEHQGYILHGHWAALLDEKPKEGIISLDTGCVYGNKLSAWCLEEKRWYSVPGYHK